MKALSVQIYSDEKAWFTGIGVNIHSGINTGIIVNVQVINKIRHGASEIAISSNAGWQYIGKENISFMIRGGPVLYPGAKNSYERYGVNLEVSLGKAFY